MALIKPRIAKSFRCSTKPYDIDLLDHDGKIQCRNCGLYFLVFKVKDNLCWIKEHYRPNPNFRLT